MRRSRPSPSKSIASHDIVVGCPCPLASIGWARVFFPTNSSTIAYLRQQHCWPLSQKMTLPLTAPSTPLTAENWALVNLPPHLHRVHEYMLPAIFVRPEKRLFFLLFIRANARSLEATLAAGRLSPRAAAERLVDCLLGVDHNDRAR